MGPTPIRTRARLLLVVPAAFCLLTGVWAGLSLLGLPVWMPAVAERMPEMHAPVLVFGFVGTLVALERAVALRAAWAYAAPALLVAGVVTAAAPWSPTPGVGGALVIAGLAAHVAQYAAIARRQPATATAIQLTAAATGLTAGVAWVGGVPPSRLVPLLAAFLILTIVGERLELARLNAPSPAAERMLFALTLAFAVAAVVSLVVPGAAVAAAGALLAGIVGWLVRFDVARRFAGRPGLPGFVAVCLLAGYGWLAVAAAGWLLGGSQTDGPLYDATTHAIFLGFVVTMIMAHAPIILPAVLGVRIPYHPALYAPVGLLHLGLAVRVVAGDAWGSILALRAGGILAAIAITAYAATVVATALRSRPGGPSGAREPAAGSGPSPVATPVPHPNARPNPTGEPSRVTP